MSLDIESVIGDVPAQEQGQWIQFEKGAAFLLVYSDSKKPRMFYLNGMNKLRRKGGTPKADKQQALMLEMLVMHVVKGWKGLTRKDPADATKSIEFPYSVENCRQLLQQSTRIRDWVTAEAADIENFGGEIGEADDETGGDAANAAMKS